MAVLLGLVVIALLGFAAPAFAGGQSDERGTEHGRDDRRPDLVGEVRGNPDRALPDEKGDGPGSEPAEEAEGPRGAAVAPAARTATSATAPAVIEVAEAPSAVAAPPAQIDHAPSTPPTGDVGGEEQRAAPTGTAADRSSTALLVLIAAALLFLAVQGRIDRGDARRADRPGDFRRFR